MRESEVKGFLIVSIVGVLGLIGVEIALSIFALLWNYLIYYLYGIFFGWCVLGAIPSINRIWNGRSKKSKVLAIIGDWETGKWRGCLIGTGEVIEGECGETPDEAYDKLMWYLKQIGVLKGE